MNRLPRSGSNCLWSGLVARSSCCPTPCSRLMATLYECSASEGRARIGSLSLSHGVLETPTALVYTRRGSALNVTPDVLETLGPVAHRLYVDGSNFLTAPTPETLQKHPDRGRGFLDWRDRSLVVTARDPLVASYSNWQKGSDRGVKVDVIAGALELGPTRYIDIIDALQPDLYVALGDEIPPAAELKRVKRSVDRSLCWLDACLREHKLRNSKYPLPMAAIQGAGVLEERKRSAAESAKRHVSGFALCGFGLGEDAQARQELLTAATDALPRELPRLLPGTFGPMEALAAVACGVDLMDTSHAVSAANQGLALSLSSQPGVAEASPVPPGNVTSVPQRPGAHLGKRTIYGTSGKAKMMKLASAGQAGEGCQAHAEFPAPDRSGFDSSALDSGTGGAVGAVMGEAEGADSVFAAAGAVSGGAEKDQETGTTVQAAGAPAFDGLHMNLLSPAYKRDQRPLVEGCTCFACRMHTRAYAHHLFNTQEMLGKVLLEVHNTHEYLRFFARMRTAIAEGGLQELAMDLQRRMPYTSL